MAEHIAPGAKRSDMFKWEAKDYPDHEGAFAVQEYIQQQIRFNPSDIKGCISPPEDFGDIYVWIFEYLRQFTLELNYLVLALDDVCNETTCPEMKVTDEWLYLCAAHQQPQECCAIDYIIHTIDGTTALLNNGNCFPNRSSILKESQKYAGSIARRLYRIFAHARFHHEEAFFKFEEDRHLCERFSVFVNKFDLMPVSMQTIPDYLPE